LYQASYQASRGVHRARPPRPAPGSSPFGDRSGAPGVPASRPHRIRLLLGVAVVVLLLVLGLLGGFLALRSSWYVGEQSGHVAVFRGVPGSFAGIRVSSLAHMTDITTVSLPAIYQQQL